MLRLVIVFALLMFAVSSQAYAPTSAKKVYATCTSALESDRKNCLTYVESGLDTYVTLKEMGYLLGQPICLPGSLQGPQLLDVFRGFLESHPGRSSADYSAAYLVLDAFFEAYPCKG